MKLDLSDQEWREPIPVASRLVLAVARAIDDGKPADVENVGVHGVEIANALNTQWTAWLSAAIKPLVDEGYFHPVNTYKWIVAEGQPKGWDGL